MCPADSELSAAELRLFSPLPLEGFFNEANRDSVARVPFRVWDQIRPSAPISDQEVTLGDAPGLLHSDYLMDTFGHEDAPATAFIDQRAMYVSHEQDNPPGQRHINDRYIEDAEETITAFVAALDNAGTSSSNSTGPSSSDIHVHASAGHTLDGGSQTYPSVPLTCIPKPSGMLLIRGGFCPSTTTTSEVSSSSIPCKRYATSPPKHLSDGPHDQQVIDTEYKRCRKWISLSGSEFGSSKSSAESFYMHVPHCEALELDS